ncbi:hypothetical protein BDW74DRAFT_26601 [Aspergillus multicolor]|uniref:uncharacterized protein n=1 Tax=Aspergillus multicolor TaxID=41759 RepID=UPI003CCC9B32
MPASPPSPLRLSHRHTRSRSSNTDMDPMSPADYAQNGYSLNSPRSMNGSVRMSGDFGAATEASGGLGNLADELADAWEDEENGYGGYASGQEVAQMDSQPLEQVRTRTPSPGYMSERDSLQLPRPKMRNGSNRHRRHESQYDGSDYGPDSDLEEVDMSPGLENQLAEIESLARRGLENNGSENDHVIERAITALQDLGAQSGIENNAMRLITAHSSITSYLTHQTRTVQNLTHPLLFAPFPLLSEEAIDALIPLIDEGLLPNLPYPFPEQNHHSSRPNTPSSHSTSSTSNPLTSLQSLISQTSDITLSLRGLSDTLYESRQLQSTASRRLRSARDLVADLRREEEGREEGTRWIERGDWDRKLRERDAGRECNDVVSGFEAFCGEWREKLFGAAGASEAVAA